MHLANFKFNHFPKGCLIFLSLICGTFASNFQPEKNQPSPKFSLKFLCDCPIIKVPECIELIAAGGDPLVQRLHAGPPRAPSVEVWVSIEFRGTNHRPDTKNTAMAGVLKKLS